MGSIEPARHEDRAFLEDPAELIRHRFTRSELLAEALTHPSVLGNPHQGRRRTRRVTPPRNYERLEFLGDRVLGLVVADLLWRRFPNEPEGPLTARHAQLVRRDTLARVATIIGLDRHLRLSSSEAAAGAARRPSVLADACEAVIAAVYLDGGFDAAFTFIERLWVPLIVEMEEPPRDPKTVLQEWAQGRGLPLPVYQVRAESGPDHARHFTVAVQVLGFEEASATASSKRSAEAGAAAALLARLPAKSSGKPGNARRKQGRG